ncbi:hypothetical protein J6590_032186 [Homalodisca vitripennis]|nr:hypothetical protein J6590_032186 [Homalodisca vitripennis]
MAAIFEFDPCYTRPSPQARRVSFEQPGEGAADDLASIFGCPPTPCPPMDAADVCEPAPVCPPPDVCELVSEC